MDIDLDDILHLQGLVTQIYIWSCRRIKHIKPKNSWQYLPKSYIKKKTEKKSGKFNKNFQFIPCFSYVANLCLIGFQLPNMHFQSFWQSPNMEFFPEKNICQGKYKLLIGEFLLRKIYARETL